MQKVSPQDFKLAHNRKLPHPLVLKQMYEKGMTVCSIARELGVHKSNVAKSFRRHKISVRPRVESCEIGRIAGRRAGTPRVYSLNEKFFDSITPESAYMIGFIQADGTINPDRFSITSSWKDIEHLEKLRGMLGSNRPLMRVSHPLGVVYRLICNSTPMANALKGWGIHSPRTWTACTHTELLFNRDYWRGMVDGDGCLCVSKDNDIILNLVGSRFICRQFKQFADHQGVSTSGTVRPNRNIFITAFQGHSAHSLAKVLYQDSTLYLSRKKSVYENGFTQWVESRIGVAK